MSDEYRLLCKYLDSSFRSMSLTPHLQLTPAAKGRQGKEKKNERKEKEGRMEGMCEVLWAHIATSKGRFNTTREKGQSPVDSAWSP